MNTREQFGEYLLLKKLSEDPLGESFRAGKLGPQGMEQVVLLRVFNGPGIDGNALWQAASGRRAVQKALSSPNIATGVDLGQVRNVPFVAYDYISGKNLASLLEQAARRRNPIPSDHALLIAERISLALAVAYETRLGDERVLHGGLVPQLVMISNEGETRALGFEVAPGLRRPLAAAGHPLARYLSPEARAGQPPNKADDVYSLGALLLELLTGKPLPAQEAAIAAAIEAVELQPDGSSLPEEIKRLLRQSLAPREQRLGDAISWHKSLSKLMFEGQFAPTTFNLAFFMHNLFRDEIEKETQEIEVERTMELKAVAPTAAGAPARPVAAHPAPPVPVAATAGAAAKDLREATGVHEDTGVIRDRYGIDSEQGAGRKKLWLGVAAAALLLVLGTGAFLWLRSERPGDTTLASANVAQTPPLPVEPAAAAPEIDEERLAAEQAAAEEEQRLLEERITALVQQGIQQTSEAYQKELANMRAELEAARSRAAEAQAATTPTTEPPAREAARDGSRESLQRPASEATPAALAATTPAADPPAYPPAEGANDGADGVAQTTSRDQLASTYPGVPPAAAAEAAAAQASLPSAPEVRRGEVVSAGTAGSVPPRLISSQTPSYPMQARRMRKEATVTVRVLVDENGRVIEAELLGAEAGFGMDQAAITAARTARYHPATKDGVPVKMWVTLQFPFKL